MDVPSTGQLRVDHLRPERRCPALPPVAVGILIALCTAKLLLHIFTSVRRYGYFRDELYYLDMARHLDWGYVDAAPLIAVYAKIALWMGGSLAALRILPALAGTALVALTILIARELGGRWAICDLIGPKEQLRGRNQPRTYLLNQSIVRCQARSAAALL
jgi:hypothetical protein